MTGILSETFVPPISTQTDARLFDSFAEIFELLLHQKAGDQLANFQYGTSDVVPDKDRIIGARDSRHGSRAGRDISRVVEPPVTRISA
jgi:hypothetical protein